MFFDGLTQDHKDLILLRLIYNFNMILIKIQHFFLKELILEFIQGNKYARIISKNSKRKSCEKRLGLPSNKQYYKRSIIKTGKLMEPVRVK